MVDTFEDLNMNRSSEDHARKTADGDENVRSLAGSNSARNSLIVNTTAYNDEISFLDQSENYCVCYVDMVDSTRVISQIKKSDKIAQYYSIFLNSISLIVHKFTGKIIKNTGDGMVCYFPQTSDPNNKSAFRDVIECGLTMMAAFRFINVRMHEMDLPDVSYRISADYGRFSIAKSLTSQSYDLFGPTMNMCAKINSKAAPNGMVIGSDLYQMLKSVFSSSTISSSSSSSQYPPSPSSLSTLDNYYFKNVGEYVVDGLKNAYPVYSVISKYPNEDYYQNLQIDNKRTPQEELGIGKQLVKLQEKGEEISGKEKQLVEYKDVQAKLLQQQVPEKAIKLNILIVEDEPDSIFTYKIILEQEGYNVDTFTDPYAALKRFAEIESSYYSLVLLDIRMPRLNGLQLYYRIKAINHIIKIIFVTALDVADELLSILPDIKSDCIIKKPVDNTQIIRAVRRVIN
jgi:CheY-like chemotaxis protein